LESVEKRIPALEKKIRSQDKEAKIQMELLKRVLVLLEEGWPARDLEVADDEKKAFGALQLITSKPIMYVCNVSEDEAVDGNEHTKKAIEKAKSEGAAYVIISAQIEEEISGLENEEEKKEFLESIGLKETGLSRVIRKGYELLGLITFFTIGPKEAHAWTVRKDSLAPKAAGVIHTDFEKGFIRSETISYDDYVKYNGEQGSKEAGKMRLEGKEYLVNDGDVLHFRFNV